MTDHETTKTEADPLPRQRIYRVTLAHRIEYAAYLVLRAFLRALPARTASNLSAFLWQNIAPKLHRHQRALIHLRRAMPDRSEAEYESILTAMWGHLGRTMAESFIIDRIAANPDSITFAIPPEVQSLFDAKRPLVMVSLHLGNWELAGIGATLQGIDLAGVYQRIQNPLVDQAVKQVREPFYKAGLFTKGNDTVKTLMSKMRNGKSVGIISDVRDNRGLPVPFFGQTANSSAFPAILSVQYDAPIVAARSIRLGPLRYRIEAELVTAPDGATREDTIFNRTAAIHAVFERWIREYPEQWMWAHRRWD